MREVPTEPRAAEELTPDQIDRLRDSAQAGLGAPGGQNPMEERTLCFGSLAYEIPVMGGAGQAELISPEGLDTWASRD